MRIGELPNKWRADIDESDIQENFFRKGYERAKRECAEELEAAIAELNNRLSSPYNRLV